MSKSKWTKIGWRSLRHNHDPKFIVRFSRNGDVITNTKGIELELPLPPLLVEAKTEWARLKEGVTK